jgi:Zn-finger nucleic acid-binding protein
MQCPVCNGTQLVMSERQGIEIDYCPQCRGVWLDRGELDKIIERSAAVVPEPAARQPAPQAQPQAQPQPQPYRDERGYPQDARHGHYKNDQRYRKKKSFLGDLFDFD